jgi:uncharacterized protein (TIGR02466 family)
MSRSEWLFATQLYSARLAAHATASLNRDLARACRTIAQDDGAGQAWCRKHGYAGYTSYASLDDLVWRSPEIGALARLLDKHVARFARDLDFDLGGRKLALDSIWINVLSAGGAHTAHIHPRSVVSGTYYVSVPPGAGAIRFEDPRLALMMAAPARKPAARKENRTFHVVQPTAGTLLLWESWLRHEVLAGKSTRERISISFNYGWR